MPNNINYVTEATYCGCGAIESLKNGVAAGFGGLTRTWSYNKRLQPVTISAASPTQTLLSLTNDFSLNVANNGSVLSVTNNLNANRTQTYTYDELNRISTAEVPVGAPNPWKESFAYDIWANLTSITADRGTPPRTLSVSVGSNNRISSTGFTYDTAGNMTADGGSHSYAWDSEGWLQSVDAGSTTYTYDGINWRAKKQTGAQGKLYWYNVNTAQVLLETDLAGTFQREYIYFAGVAMARRDPTATFYRFTDHLGSLRVVTNSTGTVVQELDYDPFGAEIAVISNPSTDDLYKFISKERDTESLNDFYWFRQYSPRLARWCSADLLGGSPSVPQSLNRYAYVHNNPVNLFDPLGLQCYCAWYLTIIVFRTPTGEILSSSTTCIQTVCGGGGGGGGGGGTGGSSGQSKANEPPDPKPEYGCKQIFEDCVDEAEDNKTVCQLGAGLFAAGGGLFAGAAGGGLAAGAYFGGELATAVGLGGGTWAGIISGVEYLHTCEFEFNVAKGKCGSDLRTCTGSIPGSQ